MIIEKEENRFSKSELKPKSYKYSRTDLILVTSFVILLLLIFNYSFILNNQFVNVNLNVIDNVNLNCNYDYTSSNLPEISLNFEEKRQPIIKHSPLIKNVNFKPHYAGFLLEREHNSFASFREQSGSIELTIKRVYSNKGRFINEILSKSK